MSAAPAGQIRIVGGLLRRTPLRVPAEVPDLRPTPDRVRETVFNWLGDQVVGARCLDLFAGTGALGFEAASRGASQVFFHDADGRAVRALEDRIARFAAARDEAVRKLASTLVVARRDALAAIAGHAGAARRFDLVFLDPPFGQPWLDRLAAPLAEVLAPGGRIYVESGAALDDARCAALGWQLLRDGRAGQVHYHLLSTTADN